MYNRLDENINLCNKNLLFINIFSYYKQIQEDPFDTIPLTYNISSIKSPEFEEFTQNFKIKEGDASCQNIWIIKPGENSNRGQGISILKDYLEIKKLAERIDEGKSLIFQKYIENPLLINKRKFDIRCYALITSINGYLKGCFIRILL